MSFPQTTKYSSNTEEPEEIADEKYHREVEEEKKESIFKSEKSKYIWSLLIVGIMAAIILFIMKLIEIRNSERRLQNYE